MEKLIELLNEYEKKELKSEFYEWEKWVWWDTNLFRRDTRDEEWSHLYSDTADTYVISKKYGFIWWLVENDKIDRWKFEVEYTDKQTLKDVYIAWAKQDELLILILSISDTPIDDLISYLK